MRADSILKSLRPGYKALLALALLAVLIAPAPADELDAYLQRQRAVYDIPAIVVGVIRAGQVVDSRAVGLSSVELGVAASTRHVFEIGSISKQFTAYAILMLSEQEKLSLHDPVGRYLTDLPEPWGRPTLHQLMGHISGLPDFEEAFGYGIYRETLSDGEFLKRLTSLSIANVPGTKWIYSNTNYWLLARVLERVSGLSYDQFMRQRVFGPLGMSSSGTALPDEVLLGRASGYQLVDNRLSNRAAMQPGTGRGLGDIVTTVNDMAAWEREQRNPRLVKSETARLAREPLRLDDGSATGYGYGWMTADVLGVQARHHDGQTAGFVAEYLRFPERDLAIVVFANRYGAPVTASRLARIAEPGLGGLPPTTAEAFDAAQLARVQQLAAGATRASTAWREDWFGADFWRDIKPHLRGIERGYSSRGPLQAVTPVGPAGVQDKSQPSFRVAFEKMTRLMTFKFDSLGRITAFSAEDE